MSRRHRRLDRRRGFGRRERWHRRRVDRGLLSGLGRGQRRERRRVVRGRLQSQKSVSAHTKKLRTSVGVKRHLSCLASQKHLHAHARVSFIRCEQELEGERVPGVLVARRLGRSMLQLG